MPVTKKQFYNRKTKKYHQLVKDEKSPTGWRVNRLTDQPVADIEILNYSGELMPEDEPEQPKKETVEDDSEDSGIPI